MVIRLGDRRNARANDQRRLVRCHPETEITELVAAFVSQTAAEVAAFISQTAALVAILPLKITFVSFTIE